MGRCEQTDQHERRSKTVIDPRLGMQGEPRLALVLTARRSEPHITCEHRVGRREDRAEQKRRRERQPHRHRTKHGDRRDRQRHHHHQQQDHRLDRPLTSRSTASPAPNTAINSANSVTCSNTT